MYFIANRFMDFVINYFWPIKIINKYNGSNWNSSLLSGRCRSNLAVWGPMTNKNIALAFSIVLSNISLLFVLFRFLLKGRSVNTIVY